MKSLWIQKTKSRLLEKTNTGREWDASVDGWEEERNFRTVLSL